MTETSRLDMIKACLAGMQRGDAEPFFLTDLEWLVKEVEGLQLELEIMQALWDADREKLALARESLRMLR